MLIEQIVDIIETKVKSGSFPPSSMNLISRIEFLKSDSIQDNPRHDSWKISALAKICRERPDFPLSVRIDSPSAWSISFVS